MFIINHKDEGKLCCVGFFAISRRLLTECGTKVSFLNYKRMVYLVIYFTGLLVIQVIGHKKYLTRISYNHNQTFFFAYMLTMCSFFADDSSLQQSSYNVLDIEQKLNHDLHVLELWSNKWLLKLNSSKTTVVSFSMKKISVI